MTQKQPSWFLFLFFIIVKFRINFTNLGRYFGVSDAPFWSRRQNLLGLSSNVNFTCWDFLKDILLKGFSFFYFLVFPIQLCVLCLELGILHFLRSFKHFWVLFTTLTLRMGKFWGGYQYAYFLGWLPSIGRVNYHHKLIM